MSNVRISVVENKVAKILFGLRTPEGKVGRARTQVRAGIGSPLDDLGRLTKKGDVQVPSERFGCGYLSVYGGDVEFEGGIAGETVTEAWSGHLGYGGSE